MRSLNTWRPMSLGCRTVLAVGLMWLAAPAQMANDSVLGVPAGYALTWADEFDVDGLPDPDNWA